MKFPLHAKSKSTSPSLVLIALTNVSKGHKPNFSGWNELLLLEDTKGEGQPDTPVSGTTPSLRIQRKNCSVLVAKSSEVDEEEGQVMTWPTSRDAKGAMLFTKYVWKETASVGLTTKGRTTREEEPD